MEYIPLLLQTDVNKFYQQIINCTEVKPPHRDGRVPHTFMLNKRNGFAEAVDFKGEYGYYKNKNQFYTGTSNAWEISKVTLDHTMKILDYIEYDEIHWALIKYMKEGVEHVGLFSKDFDLNGLIYMSREFDPEVHYTFKVTEGVRGKMMDSWKWSYKKNTDEAQLPYFERASGSFSANVVGKYIYTVSDTVGNASGTGQVMSISALHSSNTKQVQIDSGFRFKPKDVLFKVFEDYGSVLSFTFTKGIYHIHNHEEILRAHRFGEEVTDIEFNSSTLFAINKKDKVFSWGAGFWMNTVDVSDIIWVAPNGIRLHLFKSYILAMARDAIYVVSEGRQEIKDESWQSLAISRYKIGVGTKAIGIHWESAVDEWNNGLYFFSSANDFVAFGIQASGTNSYEVSIEDMGINAQHRFDNVNEDDLISVGITKGEIRIIQHISNKEARVFIFNQYYKFRHKWTTSVDISGIKADIDFKYFGNNVYRVGENKYDINGEKGDDGFIKHEYTQEVRVCLGEDDAGSLKQLTSHKLILSQFTDPLSTVEYLGYNWDRYDYHKQNLSETIFFKKVANYPQTNQIGDNILGFGLFGGGDGASSTFVPLVGAIEVPHRTEGTMVEVAIKGDFGFIGQIFGYNKAESRETPRNNTVWFLDDNDIS